MKGDMTKPVVGTQVKLHQDFEGEKELHQKTKAAWDAAGNLEV